MLDPSLAPGVQILESTILGQIAGAHVNAQDPAVVFGWSQSAIISSLVMSQLHEAGVPGDDVRFVLVGDPGNCLTPHDPLRVNP